MNDADAPTFIYLASRSPRRRELLGQLGIEHRLLLPLDGAESEAAEALEATRAGESPTGYVQRVTRAKLEAAMRRRIERELPPAPILAADTTVAVGGRILGKPSSPDDARATLQLLAGRGHRVLTAVALARGQRIESVISVSRVTFARLSAQQIDDYLATGDPFDKAGAYGIQGPAAVFVRRIEGSYSGIMGLPLYETQQLLRAIGSPRTSRVRG